MAFKNDFRPDIIAGNPPYNRGMDIDFVFDAFEVSRVAVTMIVPAKWQTSEADQRIESRHSYGDFRKEIVPHMDKVVFYPQSIDLFDIYLIDGITYYVLDKLNIQDNIVVENKCRVQEMYNTVTNRSIINGETLNNLGINLIHKFDNIKKFKFIDKITGRYIVSMNNQYSGSGSRTYSNDGTTAVLGVSRIIDSTFENPVVTASSAIFSSDNLQECKNFINWINTKFTRFFVAMNISKLGPILTDNCFKFVPEPPVDDMGRHFDEPEYDGWKKTYTDEDLYKYYNLDTYHITIINKLIKERKAYE